MNLPLDRLTSADFKTHPVWELLPDEDSEEQMVRSVETVPVEDPSCMLFGTIVRLANGTQLPAMLGNVNSGDAARNEQFITLALPQADGWFHLARYFDPTWDAEGPSALAAFLGLPSESVFPIAYDLRKLVRGHDAALMGAIAEQPAKRLSNQEIMDLILGE